MVQHIKDSRRIGLINLEKYTENKTEQESKELYFHIS